MKMHKRQLTARLLVFILILNTLAFGQASQPATQVYTAPKADLDKIMDEGMNRSQVMEHISYLTDVIGPRLTNSPGMKRANEWTRDTMAKWGMTARLEPFGPWGRGWSLNGFNAALVEPTRQPVVAYPNAWTPSTNGPITAEVVYLDIQKDEDYQKYKGQLKGKIVFVSEPRALKANFIAMAYRRTDESLEKMANAADPATQPRSTMLNADGTPSAAFAEQVKQFQRMAKISNLVFGEGAAAIVENSPRGSGGTLMVHSAWSFPKPDAPKNNRMNLFQKGAEAHLDTLPHITMASEDYNRIARLASRGLKPKMTIDIQAHYQEEDLMAYNTIAEIPGTDPNLKEEIVMLGGHLDSWHAATGATDNAAGCGVAMEAVRILIASGLKPRRTIRVALWSGEEQGLFGSKAYVAQQFGENKITPADPKAQPPVPAKTELIKKAAYDKLSVYYNLDNGTGKIRGVYMQGNSGVRPYFQEWFKPFNSLGAKTLTLSNTGGTDHQAFDQVGLPGFQFIQDAIEYESRTHHTNQDNLDRIQADDMKQAATIMAAFVYQSAMMDEKMPRKTMK